MSSTPPPPTTKQKVNFDLDLVTYFLFSVRGLVSYQDERKCQDGARPPGGQWVASLASGPQIKTQET